MIILKKCTDGSAASKYNFCMTGPIRTPALLAPNQKTMRILSQRGQTRVVVMLAACFALGLGAGAYWFRRATTPQPAPVVEQSVAAGLSTTTLGLLQRLDAPVEIRFYSLLRESQGTVELKAFAGRVAALLNEYDDAGGGNIVIKHFESGDGVQPAAIADGIEPVRVQAGEMDYLGVAVVGGGQKAVLPRIAPEWEGALEFDLSRAIARVTGGSSAGEVVVNPKATDSTTAQELLKAMPDVTSLSLAETTAKLRDQGLEEFKAAVSHIQSELQSAHRQLAEAQQQGGSAEEVARKKLQQLEAEQATRLGEISQRMQSRIEAASQLKRGQP